MKGDWEVYIVFEKKSTVKREEKNDVYMFIFTKNFIHIMHEEGRTKELPPEVPGH